MAVAYELIGFGFDPENLNILGFPENMGDYPNFLRAKRIQYMDYAGRMKGLADQFDFVKYNIKVFQSRDLVRNQ